MSDNFNVEERSEAQPFKVEVVKNTKGYSWTVRVYGSSMEDVKNQVQELEEWCKKTYGDLQ